MGKRREFIRWQNSLCDYKRMERELSHAARCTALVHFTAFLLKPGNFLPILYQFTRKLLRFLAKKNILCEFPIYKKIFCVHSPICEKWFDCACLFVTLGKCLIFSSILLLQNHISYKMFYTNP